MKVESKRHLIKFTPIKYSIEILIESQEELDNLRREFKEGKGYKFDSECSMIYYEVLSALAEI